MEGCRADVTGGCLLLAVTYYNAKRCYRDREQCGKHSRFIIDCQIALNV